MNWFGEDWQNRLQKRDTKSEETSGHVDGCGDGRGGGGGVLMVVVGLGVVVVMP